VSNQLVIELSLTATLARLQDVSATSTIPNDKISKSFMPTPESGREFASSFKQNIHMNSSPAETNTKIKGCESATI
jgi:hypothetical protein